MEFKERGKDLFINGNKVIRAWESSYGWYWFAFEEVRKQDSVIDGNVFKYTMASCRDLRKSSGTSVSLNWRA